MDTVGAQVVMGVVVVMDTVGGLGRYRRCGRFSRYETCGRPSRYRRWAP